MLTFSYLGAFHGFALQVLVTFASLASVGHLLVRCGHLSRGVVHLFVAFEASLLTIASRLKTTSSFFDSDETRSSLLLEVM